MLHGTNYLYALFCHWVHVQWDFEMTSCLWCGASMMHASLYEWHAGTNGSLKRVGLPEMWAAERLISSAALVFLGSWKGKFCITWPLILPDHRGKILLSDPLSMQPHSVSTNVSKLPCYVFLVSLDFMVFHGHGCYFERSQKVVLCLTLS